MHKNKSKQVRAGLVLVPLGALIDSTSFSIYTSSSRRAVAVSSPNILLVPSFKELKKPGPLRSVGCEAERSRPGVPGDPGGPGGPTAPFLPGVPWFPLGPGGPCNPGGPCCPGAPAGPVGPMSPLLPRGPDGPGGPSGPLSPGGP